MHAGIRHFPPYRNSRPSRASRRLRRAGLLGGLPVGDILCPSPERARRRSPFESRRSSSGSGILRPLPHDRARQRPAEVRRHRASHPSRTGCACAPEGGICAPPQRQKDGQTKISTRWKLMPTTWQGKKAAALCPALDPGRKKWPTGVVQPGHIHNKPSDAEKGRCWAEMPRFTGQQPSGVGKTSPASKMGSPASTTALRRGENEGGLPKRRAAVWPRRLLAVFFR